MRVTRIALSVIVEPAIEMHQIRNRASKRHSPHSRLRHRGQIPNARHIPESRMKRQALPDRQCQTGQVVWPGHQLQTETPDQAICAACMNRLAKQDYHFTIALKSHGYGSNRPVSLPVSIPGQSQRRSCDWRDDQGKQTRPDDAVNNADGEQKPAGCNSCEPADCSQRNLASINQLLLESFHKRNSCDR